jgi:hypothetical protein
MKTQHWDLPINGTTHTIDLTMKTFGKPSLLVDGQPRPIQAGGFVGNIVRYMDMLVFDKQVVYFVLEGNKGHLAMNGRYLDTGRPFAPIAKPPAWTYVFVVLTAAILLFGIVAIPVLVVALGVTYVFRISMMPMKTSGKVFACLGITVAAWLADFAISYLFAILFY